MSHPDFTKVDRGGETVWLHKTRPVWIVYYEAIENSHSFRYAFWQPYKAIGKVPHGRMPWTVNNEKIGREGACKSLEDAFSLASLAAAEMPNPAHNPEAAWPFPKKALR
jgi:hypothetical protein